MSNDDTRPGQRTYSSRDFSSSARLVRSRYKSYFVTPWNSQKKVKKTRLLVFVVAYNAERTIESVLGRIPASLAENYDVANLDIDDASRDRTFEVGHKVKAAGAVQVALTGVWMLSST